MIDPAQLDARPVQPSQEAELDRQDRERAIQAALATLTPKIRLAIVLRYFQDLSYAEMASVLNCSMGTVASRLSKGHALLGSRLAAFSQRDSQ
jgi:RNA polymerase sigma-70 factor (ECF subfamily)